MEMSLRVVVSGLGDLRALAAALSGVLRAGDVIGLSGHLGAGKTTLVRMLAGALGVQGAVTSPTFTLAHRHRWPEPAADGRSERYLHHLDAYRLEGESDAADLDLPGLLDGRSIVMVEWSERLTLPPDRLEVGMGFLDSLPDCAAEGRRVVDFTPLGEWGGRALASVLRPWLAAC